MNDADVKRLNQIRAVYAAASPPYTDIDFLLKVIEGVFREAAEWTEVSEMVQRALGRAFDKTPEGFIPMNFNDAISQLAKQRDEANEAAKSWSIRAGSLAGRVHRTAQYLKAVDPVADSRTVIAHCIQEAMDQLEVAP